MQPTQTGIAVALALSLVVFFFIFNGMAIFSSPVGAENAPIEINTAQNESTTMPTNTAPVTELMMKDEVVGTGAAAAAGDTVTVNYVGALTDGKVFDASANHGTSGFTFNLGAGQVIKGWDQGIVGMKEGGKRVLIIPADLAYGNQAIGDIIPANSTLVFEVELLKVQKSAQ
jgi:FKBP-type peptidyl-prolyl cis-trans isomerase